VLYYVLRNVLVVVLNIGKCICIRVVGMGDELSHCQCCVMVADMMVAQAATQQIA
jgi:hypothetical protein